MIDIVRELVDCSARVDVHDLWVETAEVEREYGIDLIKALEQGGYGSFVIAVGHNQFRALDQQALLALGKNKSVLFDLKNVAGKQTSDLRL